MQSAEQAAELHSNYSVKTLKKGGIPGWMCYKWRVHIASQNIISDP